VDIIEQNKEIKPVFVDTRAEFEENMKSVRYDFTDVKGQ
jgi:hypothetical protein